MLLEIYSFKYSSNYINFCFSLLAVLSKSFKVNFFVQSPFYNIVCFQSTFVFLVTIQVMFSSVFISNYSLPLHLFCRRAPKLMSVWISTARDCCPMGFRMQRTTASDFKVNRCNILMYVFVFEYDFDREVWLLKAVQNVIFWNCLYLSLLSFNRSSNFFLLLISLCDRYSLKKIIDSYEVLRRGTKTSKWPPKELP